MADLNQAELKFAENIRLVVWDLDETFWRGTLTEGGIELDHGHIALVKQLAERGIMSSICSKNDFDPVREILEGAGVWRYFVFPSISWEPKGPRIRAMLDQVNLRPPTVLFVDDNPTNLSEAQACVPGLAVSSEAFISMMESHPQLQGKDDRKLTRLAQYKQMESRQSQLNSAGSDVSAFLRESNIRVDLIFDLEPHLDRVIELINRTNQLNFTKNRLAEEPEAARAELRIMLASYQNQCALVKVEDNYGDHGFCGFYVYMAEPRYLLHFCFSCRILGLGVEQWIYEKLGRPRIDIQGEVIGSLDAPAHVDWINNIDAGSVQAATRLSHAVTTRGGCDLGAVTHYFLNMAPDVVGEYNYFRNGLPVRMDHSVITFQAIAGLNAVQLDQARQLGFSDQDFESRIYQPKEKGHAVILSFNCDVLFDYFKHKESGLYVSVFIPHVSWEGGRGRIWPGIDQTSLAEAERKIAIVEAEYTYLGHIGEAMFKRNLSGILNHIPAQTSIFLMTTYEGAIPGAQQADPPACNVDLNRWIRDVSRERRNVTVMQLDDFVEPGEAQDHYHFNRMVYFRIFKAIRDKLVSLTVESASRTPTETKTLQPDRRGIARLLQRLKL